MEIILASIILISVIVNAVTAYYQNRSYKAKNQFLNDRITSISELYLPVLTVMQSYYADRENYLAAKKCKELIEAIVKSNEMLK